MDGKAATRGRPSLTCRGSQVSNRRESHVGKTIVPSMPRGSGGTAAGASWEVSLNSGHRPRGSIEAAPLLSFCSPYYPLVQNESQAPLPSPDALGPFPFVAGRPAPSFLLLPDIKLLQLHQEIDQECIARTSGSLCTTTQRKGCRGERKRCLVYGLYRLLPGKSRTQTSYNQPMWDERGKRDVKVREIMSGIYYSFTGVPPCGASWRATRDPRTDRHPTWRRWIGCTAMSVSSRSGTRRAGGRFRPGPRGGGATYPGALSQAVKAKLIRDLGGVHGVLVRLWLATHSLGCGWRQHVQADPACWQRPAE